MPPKRAEPRPTGEISLTSDYPEIALLQWSVAVKKTREASLIVKGTFDEKGRGREHRQGYPLHDSRIS